MKLDPPKHTANLTTPDKLGFGNAPFSFKPASRCIYCGELSGKRGDEHIVPYALAKNSLVFPQASCRKCEVITGRYEQAVLRRMMGNIRLRFDAPTRNKKNRKPTLVLDRAKVNLNSLGEVSIGAEIPSVEIPASSAPMFYIGLLVDQPGILLGLPLGTPLEWKPFYTYKVGDTAQDHLIQGSSEGWGVQSVPLCAITRKDGLFVRRGEAWRWSILAINPRSRVGENKLFSTLDRRRADNSARKRGRDSWNQCFDPNSRRSEACSRSDSAVQLSSNASLRRGRR
jgi:hypothetical protein